MIKMLTLVKQKLFSTWMALLTNNVITSPSGSNIELTNSRMAMFEFNQTIISIQI